MDEVVEKIMKKPIPKNEEQRLVALKSYDIMDTLPEEVYSNITELASIICGTPIALISLLDENRQWFKADDGLGAPETPRDISFCQHAIMGNKIFEVPNAMEDPTFSSNPLVTGDPNIRFYAGTPLTDEDGYNLGTLCVIHTEPKKLNAEQKKALDLLGKEVISHLSTRRRTLEYKGVEAYFNKAMDMICIAGQDGYFKKVNPRFSEVLGFTEEELLLKPFTDYIHPDDLESTFKVVEELGKGVPLVEFTNRYLCKDGGFKILSWNAGVEVESGNMFAMARDVTEDHANMDRIVLESEVIKILNKNEKLIETIHEVGRLICTHLDWKMGTLWEISDDKKTAINPDIFDNSEKDITEFIDATLGITFDAGVGLPGRVLKDKKSHWVLDVTQDKNFPRAKSADKAELYAGFCFPIIADNEVQYIMEFFNNEILAANDELLRIFNQIGSLIGRFITSKRVEEQLKNYQLSVDKSSIVATTDAKGKITYVNDLFCKISGFSEKELLGQDHRIINSGTHSKEFMKNIWTTIESGNIWKGEIKNKAKDGSVYWVNTTIIPFLGDDGTPKQYIAIRHDITIQKTLSEKLDIELKAINDSVLRVELNINKEIISCNSQFLNLFGYTKEEISHMNHLDLLSPDDSSSIEYKQFWNNLESGKSQQGVYKRLAKNGSEVWISGSYMPIINSEGKVERIIKLAYDVSDTVRMQLELKKSKEIAEEATHAKDEFLANMSHEIRTPMNAIVGFTELIDATDTSEEQKEYIDSIQTASRNLLTIINDILDFSKIESGKMVLNEIPFLINDALGHTKKTMSALASNKGLKLQFYTDTDIKHEVLGDEGRLNQVLINLIGNAVKFTEKGKVEVFTSLLNETDSSYNIEFSVNDTGIGISEDKLEEIFGRFKQAEKYTTRKYGGTGLGLSISKKIIESLGGELIVESELEKGSKFSFSLEFPKSMTQIVKEKNTSNIEAAKITGANILLIEDNQLNQLLVKKFLAPEGINLTIAVNGKEGVDLISTATVKFDVILMDLQMPIMNGYDATTYIREELNSDVPIIAMTAHSLVGEQKKCYDLGMNEYISKPYTKIELTSKINKFMMASETYEVEPKQEVSHNDFYDKIRELGDGDENFIKEMIAIFLKNGQLDVAALVEASQKDDYKGMAQLAHKLKSSFGMFGLTQAFDLANKLEHHANYKDDALLKKDVDTLNKICDLAFEQLKSFK